MKEISKIAYNIDNIIRHKFHKYSFHSVTTVRIYVKYTSQTYIFVKFTEWASSSSEYGKNKKVFALENFNHVSVT